MTALKGLLVNIAPTTLQTDKGLEFLNRSVWRLLKEHGVHHFFTHNEETKASIVERFNRTLKTHMWRYFTKYQTVRYIDALQDFVQSYNDTYHRSIGMATSQMNAANQEEVWQRLYGHDGKGVPKFKVDDRVRISNRSGGSRKGTWQIGARSSSRYAKFTPLIHPCTSWSTISVRCWTEPSTNRNCRKYWSRQINCTAWNRCCSDGRWENERRP